MKKVITEKKDHKKTRRNRITMSIAGILVFIVVIGFSFSFLTNSVNNNIIEANTAAMEELSRHDQNSIRNAVNLRLDCLKAIAEKLKTNRITDADEMFIEMKKMELSIPGASTLAFLDDEGTEYTSNCIVTRNSYLVDVCSGRTDSFVIRLNTAANLPEMIREVLIEAIPVDITVDGHEMEWLICQFPVSTLEDELKISSYEGRGYSSVIDTDGYYIINMSGSHSFLSRENFFDDMSGVRLEGSGAFGDIRTTTTTTTGARSFVYTKDGQKYIMVITPFDMADWYFITTVLITVFEAQTRVIVLRFVFLLAIIAVILAIVLLLIYRQRKEQEKAEEEKRRQDELERRKIIDGIASAYNVGYVVNMADDTFENLRMDNDIIGHGESFSTFSEAKEFFIQLLLPVDRDRMREMLDYDTIRQKLAESKSFDAEYRVPINGAMIWHTMNVTAIDDDTVTIGFAVNDLEITKKHLEDIRFSEYFALYEIDLDSKTAKIVIDSPYYPVDRSGTAVPYKAAMMAFSESLEGDAREFFARMADIEYVRKVFANENKYTYTYRSSNVESKKWVDLTCFVTLRHDDGTPAMFTLGFGNIDSFGAAKQELQSQIASQKKDLEKALAMAEVASKAKTDFLFSMSHDIRTPMNAITGFTAMAKKYIDDRDAVAGYLEKIDSSGKQLLALINNVLEMARIESGTMVLDEKPVCIKDEFAAITTVLSEQAHMNGQTFNYSLEDIRHFNVFADKSKISSIVMNIISNSLKYTPEGGTIDYIFREIDGRKPGYATYVLTVADTGIGMSKEFLSTLFAPFSRAKNSTVSGIQGTGLGMAIVKRLVDLMGGEIEVQSELGKGTRFDVTIDFRIDECSIGEAAEVERIKLDVSFKGLKVLLVEDNELNREIAVDILQEEGLEVEEAEDGSIAVDMMKNGPDYYDFILMDIQMPVMNGYEATRAIRAMYPDAGIPIIAISANAFDEDRKASKAAGMNDHVAKPIDVTELLGVMAKYI